MTQASNNNIQKTNKSKRINQKIQKILKFEVSEF